MKKIALVLAMAAMTVGTAHAELLEGWSGEASASANVKSGNTKSTDIGVGLTLNKNIGKWSNRFRLDYDYGKSDGVKDKDRLYLGYQLSRWFTDRVYGFVNASYEKDKFQTYDYRTYFGPGIGYKVIDQDKMKWLVEAGAGWRRDAFDAGILKNNKKKRDYFALRGASRFSYKFNDSVKFTNDSSVIWTKDNTEFKNDANITAKLMGNLSARFGILVEHDTDPPLGTKKTDTTTRLAVVYSF